MGLALQKRDSGRDKPKPHKKYTPLRLQLGRDLADREAALGLRSCNAMDLAACAEKLQSAQQFSSTQKVDQLESLLREKHSTLERSFSSAVAKAEAGSEEEALEKLRSMAPYSADLPSLDEEILRIETTYANSLLWDGLTLLDFKNWDSAEDLFRRALQLNADDPRIAAAESRAERGRRSYELAAKAEDQAAQGAFKAAMDTIGIALDGYPEGGDLEPIKESIASQWVDHLASSVKSFDLAP